MYAPQVEALRDQYRCLSVDLRGCGASPPLTDVAERNVLAVQAQDIIDALDERGIASAHVVGISYGGAVAQTLMVDHGDRVASAIICDSFSDMRPRNLSERLLMFSARIQPLFFRLPGSWLAALMRRTYRSWPAAGEVMAEVFRSARGADLRKQRRAINTIDLTNSLRSCRIPTRCLVGDRVPAIVAMMRRLHEKLPHSQFRVIQDAADPSNLCQPEVFTTELADWMRRQVPEMDPGSQEVVSRNDDIHHP